MRAVASALRRFSRAVTPLLMPKAEAPAQRSTTRRAPQAIDVFDSAPAARPRPARDGFQPAARAKVDLSGGVAPAVPEIDAFTPAKPAAEPSDFLASLDDHDDLH